jgi:glycosyltransferase involved in cell wall biosynthesis
MKRKEVSIPVGDFIITYVASFKRQKDHRTLLKALPLIQPERKFTVLLIGDGELRKEMEILADDLPVGKGTIRFLGERKDVFELLAVTDCFAFPTLHEGMPNALLEAAAAGLPVVCTDIPENREVVGEHALFFPAKDAETLARLLEEAMRGGAHIESMRREVQRRVERLYGVGAATKKLRALYQKLI